MASPAAVQHESSQLSADTVAQEIAQDYSNQWHILEQLKSSVADVDPLDAETNRMPTPDSVANTGTAEGANEKNKADEKEWYMLNDAVSSGHASDAGSDSALEISDFRNATDVSYGSNKSFPKISSKNMQQDKDHLGKDSLYQEQWHVLEELKASVKAMQWSSHASDSSLDTSHRRDTPTRTASRNGDFDEPHKRTPAGSADVTSGSSSSSVSFSKTDTSLDPQPAGVTSMVGDVAPLANHQPDNRNISSDLSLESENLGFAELPNRPATIGNYGVSDGTTYPLNAVTLVNQPLNINMGVTQPPSTQYNGNMNPVVGSPVLFAAESDTDLSKAPMSARERLQPDGRDGPDVKSALPIAQAIPAFVSYPLSGGSSQNSSATASQPSAGSSGFESSISNRTDLVNTILATGSDPLSSQNIGTAVMYDNTNTHDNSGSQISFQTQFAAEASGSNTSLENIKGAQQQTYLPWQPTSSSSDVYVTSLQNEIGKSTTSTTSWLSSGMSPNQNLIDLPRVNSSNKSLSQDELREAVLQRIEAHTQIPGLSPSHESRDFVSTSYTDSRPSVSDSGLWSARYVGNRQEVPSSSLQTAFPQIYQDSTASRNLSSKESTPNDHSLERPTLSMSTRLELPTSSTSTTSNGHYNTSLMALLADTHVSVPLHIASSFDQKHTGVPQGIMTSTDYIPASDDVFKRPSLTDPSTRPSALDNIRSSLVHIEEQSPVSRLLGPNFKSTQDYLSKLKTDRLVDSSMESAAASKDSQVGRNAGQQPSGSFSSLSDDGYKASKEAWTEKDHSLSNTASDVMESKRFDNQEVAMTLDSLRSFNDNNKTEGLTPIHLTGDISSITGSAESDPFQRIPVSNGSTGFGFPNNPASILPSSASFKNSFKQNQGILLGSYKSNESQSSSRDGVLSGGLYSMPSTDNKVLSRQSDTPNMGSTVPTRSLGVPKENEIPRPSEAPFGVSKGSEVATRTTTIAPTRNEGIHHSSISSYETPLTSLRSDKRVWGQDAGVKSLNLRYSAGSTTNVLSHDEGEDTDDLLSYEAVLEGDMKYFRNLKNNTEIEQGHFHSSSINSKTEGLTPSHLTQDISSINGSADREPFRRIPVSLGSTGSHFSNSDEQTRRYHLSLGAGEVRPVEAKEDYTEAYREPLGTIDSGAELSSDALEVEDYENDQQKEEGFSSERNTTPLTESSSSSMYQPYIPIALRQPPSTERDSELTGNSSSTYGVYDIRLSSGPGSTNRRRKAMGLSPIPGRVPKPLDGIVYVSGDSSPLSMPDDASTDDAGSKDDPTDETLKDDHEEMPVRTLVHEHSERRRTSSRDSHNSRHSEEEHELHRQRSSSSKEGSFRSRSRASSLEEAKMIDDYIGGRKTVQHTKPRQKTTGRSRELSQSDESQSSRDSSTKNTDLNQMWERFQQSLKSSPRPKKEDSVSSHLSRLSALLSKPIDVTTTSSETEMEQYRKPRSHSYASSSSDVSTESDQPYHGMNQHSLTRQIQLRKLLETVNVADIPAFPRLRHRDTTTTSSTLSDTSTSEVPIQVHAGLPRSNRGSRKVSKTPVLEPFVKTRPRSAEISSVVKHKCICAINTAKPALKPSYGDVQAEMKNQRAVEKKNHRPRTFEVGVNVPSPNVVREKKTPRPKKGYVDVGVQTRIVSDEESNVSPRTMNNSLKSHQRAKKTDEEDNPHSRREASSLRRKERHFATQNSIGDLPHRTSPPKHKERYFASHNSSTDSMRHGDEDNAIEFNGWDGSNELINHPRNDVRSKGKHHREQNSPHSRSKAESHHSTLDTSGPVWFYPMTNRHYSRPSPSTAIQPGKLRFEEQTVKTYSPPAAPPSTSMQKLSLQDAFHFAKPDFVKRSRARMSRIERNKNVRENGESKEMGEERVSKMEIPVTKPIVTKPPSNPKTEKLHRPKPRQLSKKEMKAQNIKLYNNLPEVKAKKDDDRRTNFYKTNRLRAKLYDKRVRENLKKRYSA